MVVHQVGWKATCARKDRCVMKWMLNKYCFVDKKVTRFVYCDNCGHYFCADKPHCEWDWDSDYPPKGSWYPIHKACL